MRTFTIAEVGRRWGKKSSPHLPRAFSDDCCLLSGAVRAAQSEVVLTRDAVLCDRVPVPVDDEVDVRSVAVPAAARPRPLRDRVPDPPEEVRERLLGNPHARKHEVATALVERGFGELRDKLPQKPPHPVLGYRPRDKYWLHVFDALAVAVASTETHDGDHAPCDLSRSGR